MRNSYIKYENGRVGPVNGLASPRYAGIATFARLPTEAEVDDYDIAIVGVPFDAGVSYRSGARFGPQAIRQASRLLRPYNPAQETMPFRDAQVIDAGDIPATPFSITDALDQIAMTLTDVIGNNRRAICLGGDHTIALPALRATAAAHGPLALIHFDAHLDTWNTYFDAPYTHGTPFRRASEEGLIVKGHSAHVGTRSTLYDATDLTDDKDLGFTILSTRQITRDGIDAAVDTIHERVGSQPTYISIDVDVMDPAFTPGTGTPEAGGLLSREVFEILRGIRDLNVVGADIVEVSPEYDHGEITAVAAANLAYELISILTPDSQS